MSWATISRSRGPRSRAAATARLTTVGLSAFEPMRFMAGRWRFGGDLAVVAWESDGQLVVSTAGDSSIAPSRVGAAWTGRTRSSRKESSTSSRTPCVKNSRMRPSQSRLKSPFVNPNPNAEAMEQQRSRTCRKYLLGYGGCLRVRPVTGARACVVQKSCVYQHARPFSARFRPPSCLRSLRASKTESARCQLCVKKGRR